MGDMMYTGTLSYYGKQQGMLKTIAFQSRVKENIRVGHGIFAYEPELTYLYGLPWILTEGRIQVDLADLSASEAMNGNQEINKKYRLESGMLGSALEHMIPEQMFNTDPENPVQGVSTMRALELANTQGQRIYTITQVNIENVLPSLNHSPDTISDISAAVSAGYIVTTHTTPIQVSDWIGSGYIIADQSGNAVYMISGGLNGGSFDVKKIKLQTRLLNIGIAVAFAFILPGSSGLESLTEHLCLTHKDLAYLEESSSALALSGAVSLFLNPVSGGIAYMASEIAFIMLGRVALMMHTVNTLFGKKRSEGCAE